MHPFVSIISTTTALPLPSIDPVAFPVLLKWQIDARQKSQAIWEFSTVSIAGTSNSAMAKAVVSMTALSSPHKSPTDSTYVFNLDVGVDHCDTTAPQAWLSTVRNIKW